MKTCRSCALKSAYDSGPPTPQIIIDDPAGVIFKRGKDVSGRKNRMVGLFQGLLCRLKHVGELTSACPNALWLGYVRVCATPVAAGHEPRWELKRRKSTTPPSYTLCSPHTSPFSRVYIASGINVSSVFILFELLASSRSIVSSFGLKGEDSKWRSGTPTRLGFLRTIHRQQQDHHLKFSLWALAMMSRRRL